MTTRHELRPVSGGFIDVDAVMRVLANHAIEGSEICEPAAARHTRLLPITSGQVQVTIELRSTAVILTTDAVDDSLAEVVSAVRRWCDLDTDLEPIVAHLASDPLLAASCRERPAVRVTRFPDGFEGAVTTVLGQQVSLAALRTLAGRVVRRYGSAHPGGLLQFPDPATLAAVDPERFATKVGMPRTRAHAAIAVAQGFSTDPRLHTPTDAESFRTALLEIRGVGPWTADYMCVRLLGDPDAFTPGDLIARRAMGVSTSAQARDRAQSWHPYRAYALAHLWLAAG